LNASLNKAAFVLEPEIRHYCSIAWRRNGNRLDLNDLPIVGTDPRRMAIRKKSLLFEKPKAVGIKEEG